MGHFLAQGGYISIMIEAQACGEREICNFRQDLPRFSRQIDGATSALQSIGGIAVKPLHLKPKGLCG